MTEVKIPEHWTAEQATAVFEFIDEIREEILTRHQVQIMEYMKKDRCYDSEHFVEFEDKDIPF